MNKKTTSLQLFSKSIQFALLLANRIASITCTKGENKTYFPKFQHSPQTIKLVLQMRKGDLSTGCGESIDSKMNLYYNAIDAIITIIFIE